jgi:hypothetical protein
MGFEPTITASEREDSSWLRPLGDRDRRIFFSTLFLISSQYILLPESETSFIAKVS